MIDLLSGSHLLDGERAFWAFVFDCWAIGAIVTGIGLYLFKSALGAGK